MTGTIAEVIWLTLILSSLSSGAVQNQLPASDPRATALAVQSVTALTGGNPITDVTLNGNATWIAGSDRETGSATLLAKGTNESRIDLSLTNGLRTDIRNDTAGFPQGESIAIDGSLHPWAVHNCWINASWFFAPLSFLATTSDPNLVFTYVGQELRGGTSVQHLRIYRYLLGQSAKVISLTQQLSTIDIYLDASSFLPVAYGFNIHPDEDATANIAAEIDFSNYQAVNGIQVPFHIQKLIDGGLAVDIIVTVVNFNSGLSDSLFAVQ